MQEYHDPSVGIDASHRHEISVIQDYPAENQHGPVEVDVQSSSKIGQCCKNTAKFLFSHIGLVVLVIAYSVAGGFLFELLERHREKVNCQIAHGEHTTKMTALKQEIVSYIRYNTTGSTASNSLFYGYEKDNATQAYEKIANMLIEFREFVIENGGKYRFYGDDCSITNKWTFANSLLFAITIITTIGYGNITPVTWEGQICCICYATIGIPIFLLCVANISQVLGNAVRFVYKKLIGACCYLVKRRRAKTQQTVLQQQTDIGRSRANNGAWQIEDNVRDVRSPTKKSSSASVTNNPMVEDENQQQNEDNSVPLTLTMLIIVLYIFLGAFIFHRFEDWSMVEAAYFCFITLATIGFGDFVPGQRTEDSGATAKLLGGALYVLIGMGVLAMCFNLMQDEIVAKFRWIGRKIGIYSDSDPASNKSSDKGSLNEQTPNNNDNRSSPNNRSPTLQQGEKVLEDDFEYGWQAQRTTSAGSRKLSPRTNIARVHPMTSASNEATLHQRATSAKQQQ